MSPMGYNRSMFRVLTTPQFDKWLDGLRDPVGSAAINLRLERAKLGNLGQWRAIGDGVNEMKIDVGPGYRAYFVRRGKIIVVVLCGGDKSTQKKDIKTAKQIAAELED
ncbi:type II toxin-antitoxin system RelE/ParE family toxin [Burkholderia sp. Bp9031]|nr:type II toxin-antitoxin system RelE/ParE family toxin [Burkholderia sp. Bp9031]